MTATESSLLLPTGTRVVHIGPPKTGTTTLQVAFHKCRDDVLAQGVRYAGRSSHSRAAALSVVRRPSHRLIKHPPPISKWHEIVREVRHAKEPRVLYSSELLADADDDTIERIASDLGPEQLHVVVTLRPLHRLLSSQWQQYVQGSMKLSFDAWLELTFNGPSRDVNPTFWRRHRHDELIERWSAVVGPENMTVVVVDERDYAFILRTFEQLLGLREGTLILDEGYSNRSMTLGEIEAVRAFNVAFTEEDLKPGLYDRAMPFGAAIYMKIREPKPDESRIETPAWAINRAGEIEREMIDRIKASGVRVAGDLESLVPARLDEDPAPIPDAPGAGTSQSPVPAEVAASMAMGILVSLGLGRKGKFAARGRSQRDAPVRLEPPDLARFSNRMLAKALVGRYWYRTQRWIFRFRQRLTRQRPILPGPRD
jgi:hypothetical protein